MIERSRRNAARSAAAVVAAALAIWVAGCQPGSPPTGPASSSGGKYTPAHSEQVAGQTPTANSILELMVAAYRQAKSYADAGQLIVHVDLPGGRRRELEPAPLAVAFGRPNRLRVQAFMANVICDGKSFWATTEELEGQVLVADAPAALTLEQLASDPMLAGTLAGGVNLSIPQLNLLLSDDPLAAILPPGAAAQLGDDETIDERPHHRVDVTTAAGKSSYWIDAQTHAPRRVELPAPEEMRANLAQQGPVADVRIVADLVGAQFDRDPPAGAFEFQTPSSAKLVRRFLQPPPDPPPAMLGQKPPVFTLTGEGDSTLESSSLAGKYAILFFWIANSDNPESCERGLVDMQRLASHLGDDAALFAVNADDERFTDRAIREVLGRLKVDVPTRRDADGAWRSVLQLPGLFPALVILAPDGAVTYVHVGYEPHLDEAVLAALGKLRAGDDLAAAAWQEYQARRTVYDRQLADVLVGSTQSLEIPRTKVAERSEPQSLALTKLWNLPLKSPGNVLVVADLGDEPRVFVLESSRTLVECQTATGEVQQSLELDLPEGVAVSFLRSAVDVDGRRWYVAFASTAQELYVFDDRWQRVAKYPDSPHAGLADVRFADLGDGRGLGLLVSYFGAAGVQGVSLAGERQWSNRRLENVLSVAAVHRGPDVRPVLWCASGREGLLELAEPERSPVPRKLPDRSIVALVAADLNGDMPDEVCAISAAGLGEFTAVGLDEQCREIWHYDLPPGVHPQPIEWLTWGQLGQSGSAQWLLAAADGSIHILSASGEPIDRFNYGSVLCGLATAAIDGQPVLLVASDDDGLTAWGVETRAPSE